eukprot:m.82934 g.82934  ORF g.82934 m.82934 type:complete len:95 (+) comp12705_c0_seq4:331-615(+)
MLRRNEIGLSRSSTSPAASILAMLHRRTDVEEFRWFNEGGTVQEERVVRPCQCQPTQNSELITQAATKLQHDRRVQHCYTCVFYCARVEHISMN